jgi:hypothetical protein
MAEQAAGSDPLVCAILARPHDAVLWQTSYADGRPSTYRCVIGGKEVPPLRWQEYLALVDGGGPSASRLEWSWE